MASIYIPPTNDGWLPIFVLVVGVTAITNAIQCYRDISYLQRIYTGSSTPEGEISIETTHTTTTIVESNSPTADRRPSVTTLTVAGNSLSPTTPLSARTFGTWNIAVGIVRIYAAYHLREESWYQMSIWTNIIGLFHFGLEAFVYKTAKPSGPWLAPTGVAIVGLIWHLLEYNNYVKQVR